MWHEMMLAVYTEMNEGGEAAGFEPLFMVMKATQMVGWDDPPGVESVEDVTAKVYSATHGFNPLGCMIWELSRRRWRRTQGRTYLPRRRAG